MPFKTGKSGNDAGRPKGSPNKATKPLRDIITEFVNNNWYQVEKDFKSLEAKDRLQFFEKLLKYSLPTLQAINLTNDLERQLERQLESLTDEQLETLMNKILEKCI